MCRLYIAIKPNDNILQTNSTAYNSSFDNHSPVYTSHASAYCSGVQTLPSCFDLYTVSVFGQYPSSSLLKANVDVIVSGMIRIPSWYAMSSQSVGATSGVDSALSQRSTAARLMQRLPSAFCQQMRVPCSTRLPSPFSLGTFQEQLKHPHRSVILRLFL